MKRLLVLAFLASPLMAGTDDLTATGDLGLVIERATGRRYAEFLSREVLAPLGAAGGEIWINRPGGLAHPRRGGGRRRP